MLEKYRPNFESLSREEAVLTATAIAARTRTDVHPSRLFDSCCEAGLDQADVVLAMAPDPTPLGVVCLEKIVGSPIVRPAKKTQARRPRAQQQSKQSRSRAPLRDDRVIRIVATENPKKPGSKSHARFEAYQDGMTVQEFCLRGGTRADVKWDAARGYIRIEGDT